MPSSVCRSISSSEAAPTSVVLVCSGRLRGGFTARTRMLRILSSCTFTVGPGSLSREARLALFHECPAAFLVVRAVRAALHRRLHLRVVRLALRLDELLDDRLRVGDRQRRVVAEPADQIGNEALELRI